MTREDFTERKVETLERLNSISESLTSATMNHYLINNDINSISSKNTKAKSLNIPIITEEDFIKMLK